MNCCKRGKSTRADTHMESKPAAVQSPRFPPSECDGYPPILFSPKVDSLDEVNFFLPFDEGVNLTNAVALSGDGDTVEVKLPKEELACTLVRAHGSGVATDNENLGTLPTSLTDLARSVDTAKPVIILCHGFLSWRNQMLIANLAFGLADRVGYHTIRFDFRGNGHSSGSWSYSNYDRELLDLRKVVEFVHKVMCCRVACIVGHSKGSVAALRHAWEQEDEIKQERELSSQHAKTIPCYVNLAGRYAVPGEFNATSKFSGEQWEHLETVGSFVYTVRGHRKFVITKEDVNERVRNDMSPVRRIKSASVLTIHGDADALVACSNAYRFGAVVPNHQLCVIEGADHNFNGLKYMEKLVSTISEFVRRNDQG